MNAWWLRPAAEERHLLDRHADELGQVRDRELHGVAEADDLRGRRARVDEPAEHRHRVRVVEEPGARAQLGHLTAERQHVIRGPERAEDPTDAEGVGDRLAEAVAGRDLEVLERRLVAADLDHVEDVVGALEGRAPVEVRADPGRGAAHTRDVGGHRLCGGEPVRVDVVQRDLDAAQLRALEDVAEQVLREDDAPGADEGDARGAHSLLAPRVRPLMNCRCSRAKMTIVGITTRIEAAAIRLLFVKNCPWRPAAPR